MVLKIVPLALLPPIIIVIYKIFHNSKILSYITFTGVIFIFCAQVIIVYNNNFYDIKVDPWNYHKIFIKNENSKILDTIEGDHKNIHILSANDDFRGSFIGHFYTSSWHNFYLNNKLSSNQIEPKDFLSSFDYYLIDKRKKLRRALK